jgi:hypothetical protein
MNLFVILYVWQNIQMVQIEMRHRSLSGVEERLVRENDRLLYEIERYRRMDAVTEYARKNGLRRMLPGDSEVLMVKNVSAK